MIIGSVVSEELRWQDFGTDRRTDGRTDGVTALLDLLSPSATQVKILTAQEGSSGIAIPRKPLTSSALPWSSVLSRVTISNVTLLCSQCLYITLSKRTFRNIKVFHTLYIEKLTKLNIHLLTAKNLGTKIMPYTSLWTNKREIWDYTSGKNDENRLWNKAFMRDLGF